VWNTIFTDLSTLGYPWQSNRILGVFFQQNGMGAPALGGGENFLTGVDEDNNRLNGDCLEPGCASSVAKGGAAHELGHAFGLSHTVDDPEGSPGKSLMSYGFYGFPQCTLVNTTLNPERNDLYASPFFNIQMGLTDGGFEDCLSNWSIISGTAGCSSTTRRSGLGALALSPRSGAAVQVRQQTLAAAQQTYDISAWINSPTTGNHHVWIQVVARDSAGVSLNNIIFGDLPGATDGWQRVAYSFTSPAQATSLQILINAAGTDTTTTYVDDVDVHESLVVPPIPLQMFYFDGDTVDGTQPTLQWDDETSATNFQVQVGLDSLFNPPLLDVGVTSPSFRVPSGLSVGSRYFWRVRATNGVGVSDWSNTWSFAPAGPQDYLSDEFENTNLNASWSWIREDPAKWYLGGPPGRRGSGYISIAVQAGDLLGTYNNAKNLLLKNPPEGSYDISTKIDFWDSGPSVNYQQAGLLIYQDDNNYLKLVRIYSDGNKLEWLAEVNGVIVEDTTTPVWSNLPIRITWDGNRYSAKYSADSISWTTLGSPVTVAWRNPKIGLAAFSRLDVHQINAYFDYFRVSVPPEFTDVPYINWAWDWIERLYAAGITSGCGTNPLIYCPEQSVTRAQMAVFLERGMHGATYIPPTGSGAVFVDVSLSTWGVNWIEKLYADGITGGCLASPLSYCPANPVTRAQMAKFLLLAKHGASYSPPVAVGIFADVPASYWAASWIEQLYTEGITGGCSLSPLSYCPESPVTRAQMAKFLVLTFNLP
jgi:regulation of enolase protein 1 (concanavalin A-like superfamily)